MLRGDPPLGNRRPLFESKLFVLDPERARSMLIGYWHDTNTRMREKLDINPRYVTKTDFLNNLERASINVGRQLADIDPRDHGQDQKRLGLIAAFNTQIDHMSEEARLGTRIPEDLKIWSEGVKIEAQIRKVDKFVIDVQFGPADIPLAQI